MMVECAYNVSPEKPGLEPRRATCAYRQNIYEPKQPSENLDEP